MFTVSLEVRADRALTEDEVEAVAAIGGAASWPEDEHGRRLGTTLTVEARDAVAAAEEADRIVRRALSAAAHAGLIETPSTTVVELEVVSAEEFDRRNPV